MSGQDAHLTRVIYLLWDGLLARPSQRQDAHLTRVIYLLWDGLLARPSQQDERAGSPPHKSYIFIVEWASNPQRQLNDGRAGCPPHKSYIFIVEWASSPS
ncbi:hypothetical protein [Dolichospermum flos-aquae]|uniref:Uncharacterized protein n=1 Tax=Dolichospermum flos-aquae LEGE 04289 TaxID=1828708 RepID=A0ACC5Q696_DOLFA|nr:hypothetical protein [Dolichospermum flos-aquae]MBE9220459.1 hypothetical protein [Dolichospermum flos-aquae LEGE 04289]